MFKKSTGAVFLVKCNLLEQVNCKDQLMNDADGSPFDCDCD
jgi:hypothetical protein